MGANTDLAELFRNIADLLDLQGERFKPEAYRRAARSIESLPEDIRKVADRGGLDEIPGVGEAIGEKIREYLRTGSVAYYERLRREVPPGVIEMMQLPGLGPKTARRFYIELQVEGPAELREAIRRGRLNGLKGFGPRKIALIQAALEQGRPASARIRLSDAYRIAAEIASGLTGGEGVDRLEVAGSYRRRRESVGDLDVLVTSTTPEAVFDQFSSLSGVDRVVMRGPTKETAVWKTGLQVDLRVVEPAAFGAALVYFTGSKDHNIHLRSLARDRGLKVNEYGVFRGDTERIAGATEAEVYAALDLPWIPAEIREDRGEIEAAAARRLPELVEPGAVRGVLHEHVEEATTDEVQRRIAARRRAGSEYLGIVLRPGQEGGVSALRERIEKVGRQDAEPLPRLLIGVERALEGNTAFTALPAGADYFVGVPSGAEATPPAARPVGALSFVGHLSFEGSGGEDRASAWLRWAKESGSALEVTPTAPANGLDSRAVRQAVDTGVDLVIDPGSDDLGPGGIDLAVGICRRGWAPPDRILNARPWGKAGTPARRQKKG